MTEPLLKAENLKKYFNVGRGKVLQAVDGVTFSVNRGQTLGLVGESGCGKTTVGRTLMHIYDPDGGTIHFDGRDITHVSGNQAKALTRRMQMIFQDPYASLNPFFTVGEIIAEGLEIHKLVKGPEKQARINELLEMVGLNKEHANRFPHEFSGGQRQRVGIARALALNPEFIICDEPISALDVSIQAQVVNMLMRFQRDMGLTYLFIAHDLSMVRHIANQTAVMYLGTLVEYADNAELYGHPVHPYTQGLLSAVPVADPDYERSHRRISMAGEVPSPINPGVGCRFAKRCPRATAICSQQMPALTDIGAGHMAACHNL